MNRGKGWYDESIRHSLASRGIQTNRSKVADLRKKLKEGDVPPEDLYPVDYYKLSEGDRPEAKKFIKLFWWSSVNDNWNWIDFDEAFKNLREAVDGWLDFNIRRFTPEKDTRLITEFLPISEDRAVELIKEGYYEQLKEEAELTGEDGKEIFPRRPKWGKVFTDMLDLADDLEVGKYQSTEKKIEILDELVHQEHIRSPSDSWSWLNIDMDELRNKFEEEYI